MAPPDYFSRNAVAASQVLAGFDETKLAAKLETVHVGIAIGRDGDTLEGQACVDLLVRVLARLYPSLSVRSEATGISTSAVEDLARRVNPLIDFCERPDFEVVIGLPSNLTPGPLRIFAGSSNWQATISSQGPLAIGRSENPIGPGLAACLAAANLFRAVFLEHPSLDLNASLCPEGVKSNFDLSPGLEMGDAVLVGCGAIGNAAAWALCRAQVRGVLHLVDREAVDLGNLQRYVLCERTDVGRLKTAVAGHYFRGPIKTTEHPLEFGDFVDGLGHRWARMLLALDSAADRRAAQASLPKWIGNAWTQPGDLGVSAHNFLDGACVSCLYLPEHSLENEDAIIANTFGTPERLMQIRVLLHTGEGIPRDLMEAIATARSLELERLLPFLGRPVRSLYVEGFCGGAVIPLTQVGVPRSDVHVPLAHQSALAGVLLAAALLKAVAYGDSSGTTATRLDVLSSLPAYAIQPVAKDARGICICQDADYLSVYQSKYAGAEPQ